MKRPLDPRRQISALDATVKDFGDVIVQKTTRQRTPIKDINNKNCFDHIEHENLDKNLHFYYNSVHFIWI